MLANIQGPIRHYRSPTSPITSNIYKPILLLPGCWTWLRILVPLWASWWVAGLCCRWKTNIYSLISSPGSSNRTSQTLRSLLITNPFEQSLNKSLKRDWRDGSLSFFCLLPFSGSSSGFGTCHAHDSVQVSTLLAFGDEDPIQPHTTLLALACDPRATRQRIALYFSDTLPHPLSDLRSAAYSCTLEKSLPKTI